MTAFHASPVSVHLGVAIVSIDAAHKAATDPATRIEVAAIHNAAAALHNRLLGVSCCAR